MQGSPRITVSGNKMMGTPLLSLGMEVLYLDYIYHCNRKLRPSVAE